MTADEIQAAIDRAEEKRAELQDQQLAAMASSKVFTMLPRAAEAYRRQITLGLDGDPRAALKARMILRELFGGKIRLVPQLDGGLMAHWNLHPGALLKSLGTYGGEGGPPAPLATIRLPLRLRPGYHTSWGPADLLVAPP